MYLLSSWFLSDCYVIVTRHVRNDVGHLEKSELGLCMYMCDGAHVWAARSMLCSFSWIC